MYHTSEAFISIARVPQHARAGTRSRGWWVSRFCRTAAHTTRFGFAIAAGLIVAVPCPAQVNKCVNPDGSVELTDKPCGSGKTGGPVQVRPNTIDTSGMREQSLKAENERLRQELGEQRQRDVNQPPPSGRTYADLQAERAGTRECQAAQRSYEIAAGSIVQRGDTVAKQRKMYADCGMREPDTVLVVRPRPPAAAALPPEAIVRSRFDGCFGSRGTFFPG